MSSVDPEKEAALEEATPELYRDASEKMANLPNYYAWIASRFRREIRGTVLELGCGAGFVMRNYIDRVDRVIAVDFEENLLERLARAYPSGKVRPLRVDLTGDWHELAGVKADAIIALDVLEHFEDDGAFVDKLRQHLNPGGKVVLKVPGQSSLYNEIDRASGHFRRYDPKDLRALMEPRGFKTISIRHMNAAGAWGYRWKGKKRAGFSSVFSPTQLKVVNALIPALALLDRVPGLKGLSLVGVFRVP